jgi:hypothetical protein
VATIGSRLALGQGEFEFKGTAVRGSYFAIDSNEVFALMSSSLVLRGFWETVSGVMPLAELECASVMIG